MNLRMTEEEYAQYVAQRYGEAAKGGYIGPIEPIAHLPKPKRAKYGNRKVEIDGMKFDSQHEADYYFTNLLILYRAGRLRLLARQVPFDLPGGIKYVADFVTVDTEGNVTVIDAKSEITRKNRVYINKKKQMRAIWGIEIQEV